MASIRSISSHWLLSSISESLLGHIVHYTSASEIWKNLEQLFSTKSKARLLHLRFLLHTTKKGSLLVEDYILIMKNLAHDLLLTGQAIPDNELVLYISGGLGSEYESVVVNLTARESVTLAEAQFMLQTHELRLETFNSTLSTNISHVEAHLTHKTGNLHLSSTQSFMPRGSSSPIRGRGGRGRFFNGGRGFKVLCQICGKTGHPIFKFYHRYDVSFVGVAAPHTSGFHRTGSSRPGGGFPAAGSQSIFFNSS